MPYAMRFLSTVIFLPFTLLLYWPVHPNTPMHKSFTGETSIKGSDKADGWYATVGVPVTDKCKIYGKWDVYRDQKNKSSQKSIYSVAVNYYFYKNLKIQGLYGFVEDNSYSGDKHYNTAELQLYWRF